MLPTLGRLASVCTGVPLNVMLVMLFDSEFKMNRKFKIPIFLYNFYKLFVSTFKIEIISGLFYIRRYKRRRYSFAEFISFFIFFFFTLGFGVFVLLSMQELTPELRSEIEAMVQRGGHIWSFL